MKTGSVIFTCIIIFQLPLAILFENTYFTNGYYVLKISCFIDSNVKIAIKNMEI